MSILSHKTDSQSKAAQEARRGAVEKQIVKATISLLNEGYAYADLSVSQITGRTGLSRSAFYDYFADKRALILHMTLDITRQLLVEAEQWRGEDFSLPQHLPKLLRSVIRLYTDAGPELRAITEAANYDEVMRRWWHDHLSLFATIVKDRIELEQANGKIVKLNAEAAAYSLVWMVQQTCYQELIHRRRLDAKDIENILTELITRALFVDTKTRVKG